MMTFAEQWAITGPRVLVERDETEYEKLSSLIHIPEEALKREANANISGTVLQVGEQCYNLASQKTRDGKSDLWCKPGDRVIFGQHCGSRILKEGAEKLVILNDEDILMVMRE